MTFKLNVEDLENMSTEMVDKMTRRQSKPRKLRNGALVIASYGTTVLAIRDEPYHPYVTWRVDQDDNPFLGHYFDDLEAAVADFKKRTNQ